MLYKKQDATIRGEIGTLAASNQVYDVQTDNSLNTSDMMGHGVSRYSKFDKTRI